jgi:glycosyltransferase involved in cell wall biosynthesis
VSDLFTNYINKLIKTERANTIKPMISYTLNDVISERHYYKDNNFQLLYLGRIDKEKGLYELLEAIKIINNDSSLIFHLNVVGDGPEMLAICNKAEKMAINKHVSFFGHISNLEEIKKQYLESDIYILPTYHEGFPRTLYEAMIFGTPIITTIVGGIGHVMRNDFNCKAILPKSVDSLVKAILYAFFNYAAMGNLAKNATNTVYEILYDKKMTHAEHLNKIIQNKHYVEKILE